MRLPPDQFKARESSLEAAFFQKVDAQLLSSLRNELAALESAHHLAHVSGILEPKVLADLVKVGVTAESLLAVRFVPMVYVAWSDRRISPAEQKAILKAAEAEHVPADSPAYHLLRSWLETKPDVSLFRAWKDYVTELARIMPAESLKSLRERTEKLCHQVAKAAGGIIGLGSISHAEQKAIDDCVNAWKGS